MVFVKVRETYDLHTIRNKMTVIGIHTPKPDIIKKNYPGLLMQCKMYRPVSADVRVACASMQPLDPLGVGVTEGAVAPEDVFNPILYKAVSNKGMSNIEARINLLNSQQTSLVDIDGNSAVIDTDSVTSETDEFNVYYGLLSNTHDWKHANPQAGLSMTNLKPLVYEMVYNVGDMKTAAIESPIEGVGTEPAEFNGPNYTGYVIPGNVQRILGKAKEFPFIPCTSYSLTSISAATSSAAPGFLGTNVPGNCAIDIPYLNVICGCIIVPPSKLHELYYRMVVEWTIEFSQLRPIGEITDWVGLRLIGSSTHYMNYSYTSTKEALTGSPDSILDNDSCMVSANVDVEKVM